MSSHLSELSSTTTTKIASSLGLVSQFITQLSIELEKRIKGKETIVGLILIITGAHLYYRQKFSFWSKRNVKTPKPIPLFGNYLSYLRYSYQHLSLDWANKYGKVYGFYAGTTPHLVIADAKVLKQISIKDFDKFSNRRFLIVPNEYQKKFLFTQQDNHWRSMRAIMSPTFASGKIKIMSNIMNQCINELIDQLKTNEIRKTIDLHSSIEYLSMSCTVATLYGIKLVDGKEDETNTVQNFIMRSREASYPSGLRLLITNTLPVSVLKLLDFNDFNPAPYRFFVEKARDIMRHRHSMSEGEKPNDYLQIMMDSKEADENMDDDELEALEGHHTITGKLSDEVRPSRTKLTELEVACQIFMLILVATETTSALIAHTIYLLAYHPDIQDRLVKELSSITRKRNGKNEFDYDEITSHQYLDCVISETLRLMSPALYMDRITSEDYVIEDYNIVIPRGLILFLDYYAIHHDPDYWPEPDKFDPERFNSENKSKIVSGSYCPFGIGPRFCIGYRFALIEAKLAIAKLINEFEFLQAPGVIYPPEPVKPTFILNVYKDLRVEFRQRSHS